MITVQSTCDVAVLEADVNEDIQKFNEWFQKLGNDPLIKSEFAIVKTYLWWKLKGISGDPTTGI